MIADYLTCGYCENFECFCRYLQNVKIESESKICRYGNKFIVRIERYADIRKLPKRKGKNK